MLKPGGTLVYSTCTLLPEENEAIVEAFLKTVEDFFPVSADQVPAEVCAAVEADGILRCLHQRHDTDGFFAARLERSP